MAITDTTTTPQTNGTYAAYFAVLFDKTNINLMPTYNSQTMYLKRHHPCIAWYVYAIHKDIASVQ